MFRGKRVIYDMEYREVIGFREGGLEGVYRVRSYFGVDIKVLFR